ncbi:MAG: hypothetical protein Q9168_005552 [Polycauliona sp. 1 TL-2023]
MRLQMPLAKKLRLAFVFSFGFFACITSIIRLVYSTQLDPDQSSTDYQLNTNKTGLWAFAEISTGIIVSCMPLVHKTFKHLSTKFPSSSSFRKFSSSSGGSSWRRLLGRSSASGESSEKASSNTSGSMAPQIGTLHMTRASFAGTGDYLPSAASQSEKSLPTLPSPVHTRKPVPTHFASADGPYDGYLPRRLEDPERALNTREESTQAVGAMQSWQQPECMTETRMNETKRAQYDLYPR